MKITHLAVPYDFNRTMPRAGDTRACDPTTSTKSPLTDDPDAVTCQRCQLTNAYKVLRPPKPDWQLRGPMTTKAGG